MPIPLKPIRTAVRNSYFEVTFRYAFVEKAPVYDPESDTLVDKEERRENKTVCRVLAQNAGAASKYVRENAAIDVGTAERDRQGNPVHHKPVEGSVVILGVEPWEPKRKPAQRSVWAESGRAKREGITT